MIKTLSGAISVGAPLSKARIIAEAVHVCNFECMEATIPLLNITDEGIYLLQIVSENIGYDYEIMSNADKSVFIQSNLERISMFLFGILLISKL